MGILGSETLKNDKHELFARFYITEIDGKTHNATKSAMKAGYSKHSAASTGSKLKKIKEIEDRINFLQSQILEICEVDAAYVIEKLKKMAEDDIANYLSYTMSPLGQVDIEVKDSASVDTWNISEITVGKDGQFKFKLHDKKDALIKLGQTLGMFIDKQEIDAKVAAKVTIVEDI